MSNILNSWWASSSYVWYPLSLVSQSLNTQSTSHSFSQLSVILCIPSLPNPRRLTRWDSTVNSVAAYPSLISTIKFASTLIFYSSLLLYILPISFSLFNVVYFIHRASSSTRIPFFHFFSAHLVRLPNLIFGSHFSIISSMLQHSPLSLILLHLSTHLTPRCFYNSAWRASSHSRALS